MKCVLCSPVKNCSNYLDKIFLNIEKISSLFESFAVCFYYDHSEDESFKKLQNFKKVCKYECKIIINNNQPLKYRTHRIANARNNMIDFIYQNYSNYDFFIMMDSDDVCSYSIDISILKKHLTNNEWDALSFNRENLPNGNYDVWALQHEPFVYHCWGFYPNANIVADTIKKEFNQKLNLLKDEKLLDCYSAFNGFAIHRINKFVGCKYDGETQLYFSKEKIEYMLQYLKNKYNINTNIHKSQENCEHIGFYVNATNNNGAKIKVTNDHLFKCE